MRLALSIHKPMPITQNYIAIYHPELQTKANNYDQNYITQKMKLGLGFKFGELKQKIKRTQKKVALHNKPFKWYYHFLYTNLMPITQYNKAISLKPQTKLNYPENEIGSRIHILWTQTTKKRTNDPFKQ